LAAPLRKLPRSSWTRFEAELANQMWRTDFTRYTLANGEHVEILNFLDDHSRYLLACVAFPKSAAQRYSRYSATPSPPWRPGQRVIRQRHGLHHLLRRRGSQPAMKNALL